MITRAQTVTMACVIMTLVGVNLVHGEEITAETYRPLTITHPPEDQKVMFFGTVSFFCQVTGNPPPDNIYWRMAGSNVGPDTHSGARVISVPGGSVLRINYVITDSTTVKCAAENTPTGTYVQATASLTVYGYDDPILITPAGFPEITEDPPSSLSVNAGETAVLTCRASGDPSPTFNWFKDIIPVDLEDSRFSVLNDGSLQISPAQPSDVGVYECAAENSVGVAFSYVSTNLQVRDLYVAPHFTYLPANTIEARPGDNAMLLCMADGYPKPEMSWLKDGEEMEEDYTSVGVALLMLNDVQASAVYTCVAETDLAIIQSDTTVVVEQYEPLTMVQGPKDQTVLPYGSASFYCQVSGNPTQMFWRRDNWYIDPDSYDANVVSVPGGSVLRLDTIEAGENSVITCVAESLYTGETVSASANLTAYDDSDVPGFPEITEDPPSTMSVHVGEPVLLECVATGNPRPTVKWFKDFTPIDEKKTLTSDHGLMIIVSLEESDGGSYECAAENSLGVAYSSSTILSPVTV